MSETISTRDVVTSPHFSLICFLGLFFILPSYGGIAVMVGCASVLSALVATVPEQFRGRSGSLTMAHCLVAAMWIAAALVAAMTLTGAIQG